MKPSITTLRLDGHVVAIYTDDLTNVGLVFWWMCEKCHNINKAFEIEAFKHNGVYYSSRRIYIFLTEQKIKFLAFNINSKKKVITLADTKKQTLKACWSVRIG